MLLTHEILVAVLGTLGIATACTSVLQDNINTSWRTAVGLAGIGLFGLAVFVV